MTNILTGFENLRANDELVYNTMLKEINRINTTLELIPSENFPSKATLEALGSVFNISKSNRLNHKFEVKSGILEQDCSYLVTEFFKKKRKTNAD